MYSCIISVQYKYSVFILIIHIRTYITYVCAFRRFVGEKKEFKKSNSEAIFCGVILESGFAYFCVFLFFFYFFYFGVGWGRGGVFLSSCP